MTLPGDQPGAAGHNRPFIRLPPDDDALLAECEVQTFRASGPGGQHVNKTDSAVRLIHRPSGLTVTSQAERSQHLNKLDCLRKLREKAVRLNVRRRPRRPTRVPAGQRARRREAKVRDSRRKHLRGRPAAEE